MYHWNLFSLVNCGCMDEKCLHTLTRKKKLSQSFYPLKTKHVKFWNVTFFIKSSVTFILSLNHILSLHSAFVLPEPQCVNDIYHSNWTSTGKNPECSDFQSWIRVLSHLPKLFLFFLSHSIILPFSEKIGIIYRCHCRADCHPLSQGQSCRDIELIPACFNFAFWGRKQIKSSGKWWQGCSIPQAKLTTMIGKVERKIKRNLPGK